MADWGYIRKVLEQGNVAYCSIKPRYPGSWYEDVLNISQNTGLTVDRIKELNPDVFGAAFPQNDREYTLLVLNSGGDSGGEVPGPGTNPPEEGDWGNFVFDISDNQCPLPAGSYYISQHYGSGGHGGTDMACPKGTSVTAVQDGTVYTVQNWDGVTTSGNMSWGNMVIIQHIDNTGATYYSLYAHNSALQVSVGQKVTKGQQIALSGNSGNVSGAGGGYHLHLEVWSGGYGTGYRVNPENYVPM